jgi:hypothetical protein
MGINKVARLIGLVFVSLLLFVSCVMAKDCENEKYRSEHVDECKNVENTVLPKNSQSDSEKNKNIGATSSEKNKNIGATSVDKTQPENLPADSHTDSEKTQQFDPKNCCEADFDYSVDEFLACMSEEKCIVNSGSRTIPNNPPRFSYLKLPDCVGGNIEKFTNRVKKESENISLLYEELKIIKSSDEIIKLCASSLVSIDGAILALQKVNSTEFAKQLQKTKNCFLEIDKWVGSSKGKNEKARRIKATSNLKNKVREEWDSNVCSLVSVHQVQRMELIKYLEKRESYTKECLLY